MVADSDKRAENVHQKAEIFRSQNFPKTADALFYIERKIKDGRKIEPSDISNIFSIFGKEYSKGDRDFQALHDFISDVIAGSIITMKERFRDKLAELEPFFGKLKQSADIWKK